MKSYISENEFDKMQEGEQMEYRYCRCCGKFYLKTIGYCMSCSEVKEEK